MSIPSLELDAQKYARRLRLCYCSDQESGLRRKSKGKGFAYFDDQGKLITDPEIKKRIQQLVIPPAWKDVWISSRPDTHLQATGRDEKGRKQYIYHLEWEANRNLSKFDRIGEFGMALPAIRQRIESDLRKRNLNHQKVVAIVAYMLDKTLIRIGNSQYAASNGSFGLTTLRKRHVKVDDSALTLNFVGKSGKKHKLAIEDKRLMRYIKSCQELPGQQLFQYIDDDGQRQSVQSSDINNYLQEITGQHFTAKFFRTWGGTVAAIEMLLSLGSAENKSQLKKNVQLAIRQASEVLGNTISVCRTYYVHPVVLEAYEKGTLFNLLPSEASAESYYSDAENIALSLLQKSVKK